MRSCAANLSRLRTRKLPAPHVIDVALCRPSAPWPPANRITEATGFSGLIRMKACLAPRGVAMETSVAPAACAALDAPVSSITTAIAAAISDKEAIQTRFMGKFPSRGPDAS